MLLFDIFSVLEIQTIFLFDLVISCILVNHINCNFYVETNSYIICFIIKFRMDNSWYDMSCILMITNMLIRLQEWIDCIKSFDWCL
jgi:hypothetical protein